MKKLAYAALLMGMLFACGGEKKVMIVTPDALQMCNPLLNTGCKANEKCTWLVDALMPNYIGHIGCAPDGTKNVGETCMYGAPGATGYDDCKFGGVCSSFRSTTTNIGQCKAVCDQQGGAPACNATTHVCVVYSNLFDLGETTPAAAGVCNLACDPIRDNDWDGSGSDFTRDNANTVCDTAANEACYGSPSRGTPPATGWSCTRDINYAAPTPGLRHRVQCIESNDCADPGPRIYQNSCNQGYLPLLIEATGSTTAICVAMCKPVNCFAGTGNCGSGTTNLDRLGVDGDRCNDTDRIARISFDGTGPDPGAGGTRPNGEHCEFMWPYEVDSASMTFLKSTTTDLVGFCYDHTKYLYDADGDNMRESPTPPCYLLADGFGSGTDPADPLTFFGAADLGCVDSTRLMVNGKVQIPESAMRKRALIDHPRPLYNRTMAAE